MELESKFKKGGWDARKEVAARMIFEGERIKDVALILGVSERQIYRWKNEPEYFQLQNEFLMATRGEYMLQAKQEVRAEIRKNQPSKRDLLDWLKFLSEETDKIVYSDPVYGIPPNYLGLYMTKATRKSINAKMKKRKR
jgi:transposase-like protein